MLEEKQVRPYWEARFYQQGAQTVGFANSAMSVQDEQHAQRCEFIFAHCPRHLPTLDYGCGIGRYADEFPNYMGADITEGLVEIARDRHPDRTFMHLREPFLNERFTPAFDLFFTATVLQHNSDAVVLKLLASLKRLKPRGLTFCLYENAQVIAPHVKGRSPGEYIALVSSQFEIRHATSAAHTIHDEVHALTLIETL